MRVFSKQASLNQAQNRELPKDDKKGELRKPKDWGFFDRGKKLSIFPNKAVKRRFQYDFLSFSSLSLPRDSFGFEHRQTGEYVDIESVIPLLSPQARISGRKSFYTIGIGGVSGKVRPPFLIDRGMAISGSISANLKESGKNVVAEPRDFLVSFALHKDILRVGQNNPLIVNAAYGISIFGRDYAPDLKALGAPDSTIDHIHFWSIGVDKQLSSGYDMDSLLSFRYERAFMGAAKGANRFFVAISFTSD